MAAAKQALLTVSGVPSQGDGQGESQRSNLGALALCLDVLPPAPPVTALITLSKPVTMADNWSNKQEGGHASHRRRPAIWSVGGALAENARDWIGLLIGGNWAFLARS